MVTVSFLLTVASLVQFSDDGIRYRPNTFAREALGTALVAWHYCLVVEWLLHRAAHIPSAWNPLYAVHKRHHCDAYPVSSLLRPPPYVGEGGTGAFALPVVMALFLLFSLAPSQRAALLMVSESVCFLGASDYLHCHYHIRGSWLEGSLGRWFEARRAYHFDHHRRTATNLSLGGVSNWADRMFETRK